MLGHKNPLLVDRTVYAFKGKWINPKNDLPCVIYYFVSSPLTLASSWESGREEIKPTVSITVFGEHAFTKHDVIYLEDGSHYEVEEITSNYFESNIQVRDLLKPRVESQELVLN